MRGREAAGDVAEAEGFLEDEVGRQVLVDLRRFGLHRLDRVDEHRQRRVLHVDQPGRVLGRVAIDSGDGRDGLAGVAHLVHRQGVRHHGLGAERGQRVRQLLGVVAGDHREHARQRPGPARVDADDACVGLRAPQHGRVRHAGKPDVVGVGRPPGQQTRVLEALHVLADPGARCRGHDVLLQRAAGTAWRSAASWTASTMP
jgi:hypothetical protein